MTLQNHECKYLSLTIGILKHQFTKTNSHLDFQHSCIQSGTWQWCHLVMVAHPTLVSQCQGFHSVPPPQALSCQLCLRWLQHNRRSHCTNCYCKYIYVFWTGYILHTYLNRNVHVTAGTVLRSLYYCITEIMVFNIDLKNHIHFPPISHCSKKSLYVSFNADSTVKVQ